MMRHPYDLDFAIDSDLRNLFGSTLFLRLFCSSTMDLRQVWPDLPGLLIRGLHSSAVLAMSVSFSVAHCLSIPIFSF